MSGLHVSRLISDHMILQHGKPVHLWGEADPGAAVTAVLSGGAQEIVRLAKAAGAVVQRVDRARLDQIYPAH